jgi:hypothetical protein
MCGLRATGTVRLISGVGPLDAGKSLPNEVPPGSSLSTEGKEGLIATSPAVGPTSGWRRAKTTAVGAMITAEGKISKRAIVRATARAGTKIETTNGSTRPVLHRVIKGQWDQSPYCPFSPLEAVQK